MQLPAIVESIIFSADTPLSLDKLCELLPEYDRPAIRDCLAGLVSRHEERKGGFLLVNVAGGWQFRTPSSLQQYVMRNVKAKSVKFSLSALETLAIVAYRQPVTRAEIEYLRGVDCGGVLRTLLERRLIRILGKKDIPGRPLIYGTSKEFLEVFGLRDLKSLPTLKEIQALDDVPLFEQQEELLLDDNGAPMTRDSLNLQG
jgi:segregation and condensation protein B